MSRDFCIKWLTDQNILRKCLLVCFMSQIFKANMLALADGKHNPTMIKPGAHFPNKARVPFA